MLIFLTVFFIFCIQISGGNQHFSCKFSDQVCDFESAKINEKGLVKFSPRINGKPAKHELVQYIVFRDSSLLTIPTELFQEFKNLQGLDLANQKIRKILKNTFKNAKNLKDLKLAKNELREIFEFEFDGAQNLRKLFLENNKIEKLDPQCFQGLNKLEILDLQHNHLESLDPEIFKDLAKLRKLNLSGNQITQLEKNLFSFNLKLTHIHLTGNEILSTPNYIFHHLVELKEVTLKSNICIDENYNESESLHKNLEADLRPCFITYQSGKIYERKFEDFEKKMHENFETLRNMIESGKGEDSSSNSFEKNVKEKLREEELEDY